ncbi:MAG: hypothetical protein OIN86_16645 [Candidatus Methanoperedens sp.]|nr:hypothetical protein [Candidatus Methanoperedens sp.]CAG1003470.1 hypothetical protein METP1_03077 [Methanosarcinales archaeon]
MDTERLTKKEFEVLLYFIDNESGSKRGGSNPIIKLCKDDKKHFMAYPAKIEKDLRKEISRVWAANICKKLEDRGILDHENLLPPRQKNKTEHYYLRSDFHAFSKIVKLIVDTATSKDRIWIFARSYFQENINESLVKKVLAERNVVIGRILDLWLWEPIEAQNLFDKYFKENVDSEKISFKEYIQKMVQHGTIKDGMYWSPPSFCLRMPVFADEMPRTEQLNALIEKNIDIFDRYPLLKSYRSGIEEYYKNRQYENSILPILALIKASPNALVEFLHGEWKPSGSDSCYCVCYSREGIGLLEYHIFKILFTAISDIALTRSVPGGREDNYALLRPNPNSTIKNKNFLLLIPQGNYNVYFDGGFRTGEDYIGEDLFLVPDENYYWVKSWIEFNPTCNAYFLNCNYIGNYESFIKKLVDKNDKISHYIFNKFSNVMKNILNNINLQNPIQEELQKKLLHELNFVILNNNLYEYISKLTKLSDSAKHKYEVYTNSSKYYNKTIILYDLVELNFSLLEDIFPEQIIKRDYRVEIEDLKKGEAKNE